ncbi:MAG: beta strand repeat-containing protein, partial [Novosphingobium sp.]
LQFGSSGIGIDLTAIGSPYTAVDNIAASYASLAEAPRPFDIDVTGTISVAGRFINDFGVAYQLQGSAWTNGGSISLAVAPNQFARISDTPDGPVTDYADLSGSIMIASSALLDVSAGAYVSSLGVVSATARGGDVAFSAPTIFAPIVRSYSDGQQIYYNAPTVPSVQRAQVSFGAASLKGFGFSGGGTFSLTAPNITFGSDVAVGSSYIDLDFLQQTGFGTLSFDTFRSVLQPGLFAAGGAPNEALLATTVFRIKAGETLDLTQSLYSNRFGTAQLAALRELASGSRLDSVLTPAVPQTDWDRLAANLVLSGLTELDVEAGGKIVGAAGASITAPKLFNDGSIVLHGGTLNQNQHLPLFLSRDFSIGIGGTSRTTLEDAFGARADSGAFDAAADNAAGLTYEAQGGKFAFTNRQLATTGGVYYLGTLDADQAVVLTGRSVTDLSGTSILNPFTGIKRGGAQIADGRIVSGGKMTTSADLNLLTPYFSVARFGLDPFASSKPIADALFVGQSVAGSFNALRSATIDLRGASATFDIAYTPGVYQPIQQWSDGGTLSVLGGGTIAGASILAQGGAPAATGGTLEWLRPTLVHTSSANVTDRLLDGQIAAGGFDTLIARGGLSFDGAVSLTLDKALVVTSAPVLAGTIAPSASADVIVSASADTVAQVSAPYIRFGSLRGAVDLGNINKVAANSGTAKLTFNAGAQGIDFVGATLFDGTIASTTLNALGDLRLTGVNTAILTSGAPGTLNGELLTQGDLTVDAARVYATTGTGNLQQILEDLRAGRALDRAALPFEIAAFGDSRITFLGTHLNKSTPFSAGSYLRVQAKTIQQNGFVAAPLGLLELGGNGAVSIAGQSVPGAGTVRAIATETLSFGAGSLTSVSAADVKIGSTAAAIPYGTTTDLTEVFFTPTANDPITSPPTGELIMAGSAISVDAGALVDGRGGGDVFAYEFVSGTGGSRDVLDRFNADQFSANRYDAAAGTGYQYADKRQVFAIIPIEQAQSLAMYDPLYSADYGISGPVDLYGAAAGLTVQLDASDGVPAGEYLLLPAHYALLPGAFRLVENTGTAAPAPGTSQTLLDGSVIVAGNYATAGTDLAQSARRSFTLQSKATISRYSQNTTTSVSPALATRANQLDLIRPRLALDSARTIISPLASLNVAGTFDFTPATGGLGTAIDIGGTDIVIGAEDPGTVGALFLSNQTLDNLNANSLFIGGQRNNQSDGTTLLNITASNITINADAIISAPELLFAVGAKDASAGLEPPALTVATGAVLTATGVLADPRDGDYIIASNADASPTGPFALTGIGAALRIANGPERLFQRQGDFAARNSLRRATLTIGAATLQGANIALDSSRTFRISNDAVLTAPNIAVSGDSLRFGPGGFLPEIEAKFAAATHLTLRSPDAVAFSAGTHAFNDLTLDSQGISRVNGSPVANALPVDVVINAKAFDWHSSAGEFSGCVAAGAKSCGIAGSSLSLVANTIALGSGKLGVYGFNNQSAVSLTAANGIYVEGRGSLSIGNIAGSAGTTDSTLTLNAP